MEAARSGEGWTEERHASFLSSMEESFVSRMFDRRGGAAAVRCDGGLERRRMDRWVPDSATESTCDRPYAGHVADRKASSARFKAEVLETVESAVRSRGMKRKPSSLRYDALGDQVVPEFGDKEVHAE